MGMLDRVRFKYEGQKSPEGRGRSETETGESIFDGCIYFIVKGELAKSHSAVIMRNWGLIQFIV